MKGKKEVAKMGERERETEKVEKHRSERVTIMTNLAQPSRGHKIFKGGKYLRCASVKG